MYRYCCFLLWVLFVDPTASYAQAENDLVYCIVYTGDIYTGNVSIPNGYDQWQERVTRYEGTYIMKRGACQAKTRDRNVQGQQTFSRPSLIQVRGGRVFRAEVGQRVLTLEKFNEIYQRTEQEQEAFKTRVEALTKDIESRIDSVQQDVLRSVFELESHMENVTGVSELWKEIEALKLQMRDLRRELAAIQTSNQK